MDRALPRSRVRLGPGAEFDLIRALLREDDAPAPGVVVGPGDDCAVLDGGAGAWAVSVDLSVEGVHFRRSWLTPEEIGWRAASAALSDLAAVAAEPAAVLLALALPDADARSGAAVALQRGAASAARAVGAAVVGGDVTRTPGPLTVDVVVLGRVQRPLLRSGARPGDELWVTGRLGGAAAAVAAWERGEEPTPSLRSAFVRPTPRVREALWLAATGHLHALIDLSDGLAGDAGHIAAASGCRVVVSGPRVPVAGGTPRGRAALSLALSGGEDYELLLAAAPGALAPLAADFEARFGVPLTRVGGVEEGEGVVLDRGDGAGAVPLAGGYDHFGAGGA